MMIMSLSVAPVGSGYEQVTGSCEHGDEPAGSGATELVSQLGQFIKMPLN
jgi:hypothetical protein